MGDLKEEEGNAALVAPTEPLGILGEAVSRDDGVFVVGHSTRRRVCSYSSVSMVVKISLSLFSLRQSSVSLNCLKASWGIKRRARK